MNPAYMMVLITIISTGICYSVAKKKRAKVPFWVAMGALFGPFAVPFVFFAKGVSSEY